MRPHLRSRLLQVGSVALGGALLYLALRPVSFDALGEALRAANYWYLLPLGAVALLSHLIRAWRWLLLLQTLPGAEEGPPLSLPTAFSSVMIGYMVNYAAPRVGEVARAGNLAAQSDLPFSSIFGSVVIERVLDVVTLGAAFVVAAVIAAPHMPGLGALFEEAAGPVELSISLVVIAVALLVAAVVVPLVIIRRIRRSAQRPEKRGRIAEAVHAFGDGLASLIRTPKRAALVVSTIAIWLCYWMMTYLPLPMLGIEGVGLADAWLLLVVGSIGMMVPAPGGIGSYHYVTIQAMTMLLGVGLAAATAYAVLVHGAQLVLYALTGLVCLLVQGRGLALRTRVEEQITSS